jgi:hypothetical protein
MNVTAEASVERKGKRSFPGLSNFFLGNKPPRQISFTSDRSPQSFECSIPLQATMNLTIVLPLALALLASVLALPATVEPPPKEVDFHIFPEFAGFDSLEQLAGNSTLNDDEDDGYDIHARSPEAAAAGECTLANLKKIMFDYSESTALISPRRSPKLTALPSHV